ncbi:preprotein translocase subunit YajC [Streptococcus sp. ZJ100]|uniref:preprotein translocase subunit YajC n=1 Tax=Streptococcus handemini TaxID=3161188 RepID=UPI0032ED4A66
MHLSIFSILLILLAASPLLLSTLYHFRQQRLLREQLKQRHNYLASLMVGDEVLLLSGIHGKIVAIKEELISLQIADQVTIYVEKESIMGKTRELLF